jgi:hypothetical protein
VDDVNAAGTQSNAPFAVAFALAVHASGGGQSRRRRIPMMIRLKTGVPTILITANGEPAVGAPYVYLDKNGICYRGRRRLKLNVTRAAGVPAQCAGWNWSL